MTSRTMCPTCRDRHDADDPCPEHPTDHGVPAPSITHVVDTTTNVVDNVNHPSHYGGDTVYEHVKVAEAWGLFSNAMIYNCTKYLSRLGKKRGAGVLEDLKQARGYLDREIQRVEARQK